MRVVRVSVAVAALGALALAISGDAMPTGGSAASGAPTASTPSPVLAVPHELPEPATPDLLDELDSTTAPRPSSTGLAQVLAPYLDELGSHVGVAISADGQIVYERNATTAFIPASTAKLLTAAAALTTLDHASRFATAVVRGRTSTEIVLVGGGDPLLTSRTHAGYPARASLSDLAAKTAQALGQHRTVTLRYDATLFSGPMSAPGWKSAYFAAGSAVIGRTGALAVDGGRVGPAAGVRAADSAAEAAKQFSRSLTEHGVEVRLGEPVTVADRDEAPARRTVLARVSSPPVGALVEMMLTTSDNDMAEVLARHVALARGESPDFAGAAAAIVDAVRALGVSTEGVRLFDGSGLSRANAIPPRTLAELLTLAASNEHPELRGLLTGLPVAGFSGTLDDRAVPASAGLARAKSGTLLGVKALAGVVPDADGRLLVFVVLADRVAAPGRASEALDGIAGRLATCGCG